MLKKRHSNSEIASKLEQAATLAKSGLRQVDIARQLGVTVMTIHRWRKAAASSSSGGRRPLATFSAVPGRSRDQLDQIANLQRENLLLRKFVSDLLIEKLKLEEDIRKS